MKQKYLQPITDMSELRDLGCIMSPTVPHNPKESGLNPQGGAPARKLYI